MHEEIVIAGIGGQGALTAGSLITVAGMNKGLHVAAVPDYLPEVRGAEANCFVILSDEPIANCLITEPHVALLLCSVSAEKYSQRVRPKGLIIWNETLIGEAPSHPSARICGIPATERAQELGSIHAANMVMVGAYAALDGSLSIEDFAAALDQSLTGRARRYLDLNLNALKVGAELARAAARRTE